MEKRINRLRNKSFEKMILDQPVPNKKVKFSLRGNKSKEEINQNWKLLNCYQNL